MSEEPIVLRVVLVQTYLCTSGDPSGEVQRRPGPDLIRYFGAADEARARACYASALEGRPERVHFRELTRAQVAELPPKTRLAAEGFIDP